MRYAIPAIIVSMLCGCDRNRPQTAEPEAEIANLYSSLTDAFRTGDDDMAANFFVRPLLKDQTSEEVRLIEGILSENMTTSKAAVLDLPIKNNPKAVKVIGNFAIILVATDSQNSLEPLYLRRTHSGWKFLSGIAMNSNFLFEFDYIVSDSDLTDSDKLNDWVMQQIEKANKAEMATPRKPSD